MSIVPGNMSVDERPCFCWALGGSTAHLHVCARCGCIVPTDWEAAHTIYRGPFGLWLVETFQGNGDHLCAA